jgi:hypothetical protein
MNLQQDFAVTYEVKLTGLATLPEKMLPFLESDIRRATGQQINVVGFKTLAERMFRDDPTQVFHGGLSLSKVDAEAQRQDSSSRGALSAASLNGHILLGPPQCLRSQFSQSIVTACHIIDGFRHSS